jgi:hypothetical protein
MTSHFILTLTNSAWDIETTWRQPVYKKGEKLLVHIYNYPWSGRTGRIARQCLYCGEKGSRWTLSSSATRCLSCPRRDDEPIPALWAEYIAEANQAINKWCQEHHVDREKTEKALLERYGEQSQFLTVERDDDEVQEAFKQLTTEQLATANRRGFSEWQIKNWLRYDQMPGQPKVIPIEEGEPYIGPEDWLTTQGK